MSVPDATAVHCPHGRECGACALLGMPYEAELRDKRDVLISALGAYRELSRLPVSPCLPSPRTSGYRNRAKMAVEWRRGRVDLGYFQLRSRHLVDAPECRVLEPELLCTTQALRTVLSSRRLPSLRFIDLRSGSDPSRQHLTLILGSLDPKDVPVEELHRACPSITGISENVNPGAGPQVLRGPVRLLWGKPAIEVTLPGARLSVSPASFFQVNLHVLPAIHERLRAFLSGSRLLVDLYAGVGTHALALKGQWRRAMLVEGSQPAARDARANVERAGASASVLAAPVERSIRKILAARPDGVILNPSREGATPSVLRALAASGAERLAYLSCDPETLARDLAELVRRGFRVRSLLPIDMMPQTRQVEALALMER